MPYHVKAASLTVRAKTHLYMALGMEFSIRMHPKAAPFIFID